ncbi:hypothetical protein [Circoviridae sp.]|nr:hypothetical protein [Circoviridae sp.]
MPPSPPQAKNFSDIAKGPSGLCMSIPLGVLCDIWLHSGNLVRLGLVRIFHCAYGITVR